MQIKGNQLKIGVILSYVSMALNMIIQLTYTPIMIHLLGQSEYGLYTLVGSVVSYLSLFSLGFTGAYLRFYSRYMQQGDSIGVARLNGMFLTLFLCMSVVALLCGMILSWFANQLFGSNLTLAELEKSQILMRILVVNIALTFPSSVFDSVVSAHEQFLFQRILQLAGVIFNPLLCLPLLLLGYGSIAVVTVTTVITILKLTVNILFCLKKLRVPFDFRHFNFPLLKEIGSFSFFLFLNMIIDQANWSVDKFILGRVSGTAAVAVYGVGSQINSLFINFSTAISSVFSPRVNRIAASGEKTMSNQFTELFIKIGRIQFMVLGLIASGFLFFGEYFITDIYASCEYKEAYIVALLLILPAMIPLIQNVGIEIQRSVNKHEFRSVVYLSMAVINTIISIPLSSKYGPSGASLGTAISLLLANGLIMNIYYQKVIRISIGDFWRSILRLSRGLILPCILGAFILNIGFHSLSDFILWVFIYSIVYVLSFSFFGMNQEEKTMLLNVFGKLKFVRNR